MTRVLYDDDNDDTFIQSATYIFQMVGNDSLVFLQLLYYTLSYVFRNWLRFYKRALINMPNPWSSLFIYLFITFIYLFVGYFTTLFQ
jgi:hypothetical protein